MQTRINGTNGINGINIVKNEDGLYSIEYKYPSRALIYSLTKTGIIQGGTITDNYQTLVFRATTVKSLKEFQSSLKETNGTTMFPHDTSLKMIYSLSTQLQYLLTKTNVCFFKYDPNNIIVIDDDIFVYVSNEDLVKREKDHLCITMPFANNKNMDFLSPELYQLKSIPEKIHYKSIYYSLGLLVVSNILDEENYALGIDNILKDKILEIAIGKTKLYYFLLRCLDNEITNRTLQYI